MEPTLTHNDVRIIIKHLTQTKVYDFKHLQNDLLRTLSAEEKALIREIDNKINRFIEITLND